MAVLKRNNPRFPDLAPPPPAGGVLCFWA